MLWLRMGRRAEADADFAQGLALKPDMKSSLERRIEALQSQLSSQRSLTQKGSNDND